MSESSDRPRVAWFRRPGTRWVACVAVGAIVLAGCGGGSDKPEGSPEAPAATTTETTTTLPTNADASQVAEAIGCDDIVPEVERAEVSVNPLDGSVDQAQWEAVLNDLAGLLLSSARSSATCYLGPSEVLVFVLDTWVSEPGATPDRLIGTALTEDAKCLPGETWSYLRNDTWVVLAGGGTTDDRYEVAAAAQAKIGGDLERVSC